MARLCSIAYLGTCRHKLVLRRSFARRVVECVFAYWSTVNSASATQVVTADILQIDADYELWEPLLLTQRGEELSDAAHILWSGACMVSILLPLPFAFP